MKSLHAIFISLTFIIEYGDTSPTNNKKECVQEYIETDLDKIYGCHGVEVLSWYNETNCESSSDLVSAPGCPKSIDGFPWVYYGNPPRCFMAGRHGPCPFGEKLLIEKGSKFGVCACECLFDYDFSEQLQGKDRYVRCLKKVRSAPPSNEQIYDKQEKRCYYRYEQGPCPQGKVIAAYTSDSLQCLPLCDETNPDWEAIYKQGICAKAWYTLSGSTSLLRSECEKGEKYSKILGICVKQNPRNFLSVG